MGRRRLCHVAHVALAMVLAGAPLARASARAAMPTTGWPVPPTSPRPTAPVASAGGGANGAAGGSAASGKSRCSKEPASALAGLACELATGLGGLEGPVAVAAAPVVSDVPVSRGGELSTRLAGL